MPTLANALALQKRAVGIAKEVTKGTYAAPTFYLPIQTFTPVDVIDPLPVEYLAGNMAAQQQFIQWVKSSTVDVELDAYADALGWPIGGLLGDLTVTGAAAPYANAFSLLNSGQGQPTSHSVTDSYGATSPRAFTALQWTEVALKFTADGLVTCTAKAVALGSTTESAPTASYTSVLPLAAWNFIATINAVVTLAVTDVTVTITRKDDIIKGPNGTQSPLELFVGTCDVKWDVTALADPSDEALLLYLNNTQPAMDMAATSGTGATEIGIQVHSSSVAVTTAALTPKGEYLEVVMSGTANATTTDAGASGGKSPVKVTLTSATNGGYV